MKRGYVLLSERVEYILLAVSACVPVLMDAVLYVVVYKQNAFADRIVSNWNPVRGDATFSLGVSLILVINVFLFMCIYSLLRRLFGKLYGQERRAVAKAGNIN